MTAPLKLIPYFLLIPYLPRTFWSTGNRSGRKSPNYHRRTSNDDRQKMGSSNDLGQWKRGFHPLVSFGFRRNAKQLGKIPPPIIDKLNKNVPHYWEEKLAKFLTVQLQGKHFFSEKRKEIKYFYHFYVEYEK